MSVDSLQQAMLAAMNEDWVKIEGSPTADFSKAFATGLNEIEKDLYLITQRLDVDYMKDAMLDSFVYQRKGLIRKTGASATTVLTATVVSGKSASIKIGDSFQTADGVVFIASQAKVVTSSSTTFNVTAQEDGTTGNVAANTITIITSSINNLTAVTNVNAASGGVDAESDAELRARYYDAIYDASNGNGMNMGAYETIAKTVTGVSEARCIPCVNGSLVSTPNACALQIVMPGTGGHLTPASASLIAEVQAKIDPHQNGDGCGDAPIGATCYVVAPAIDIFPIVCTYNGSLTSSEVTTIIRNALDEQCLKYSIDYDSTYQSTTLTSIINYSAIMTKLGKSEGINWATLTLNGQAGNYTIPDYKVVNPSITVTQV